MTTAEEAPRMTTTSFTVWIGNRREPKARIEVDGVLDRLSVHGFRALMREFVDDPTVVIDLTRCRSVDEAGVGALTGAVHGIRQAGGTTVIFGASALVRDEIEAAGAGSLLDDGGDRGLLAVSPIPSAKPAVDRMAEVVVSAV